MVLFKGVPYPGNYYWINTTQAAAGPCLTTGMPHQASLPTDFTQDQRTTQQSDSQPPRWDLSWLLKYGGRNGSCRETRRCGVVVCVLGVDRFQEHLVENTIYHTKPGSCESLAPASTSRDLMVVVVSVHVWWCMA